MDYTTAKECLTFLAGTGFSEIGRKPIDKAIEALDKQIPKKPFKRQSEYYCSGCHVEGEYSACVGKNHHDGHRTRHSYCFNCGQLQDWSEEDAK